MFVKLPKNITINGDAQTIMRGKIRVAFLHDVLLIKKGLIQ